MRVALDLDSTLAATATTAFDMMGVDASYHDMEDWQWALDEFGEDRFLNAMWHAWTIRPDDVEPMEPNISESVRELYEHDAVDELDIVTRHPSHVTGVTQSKREWLAEHDIPHNDFHAIGFSKADLGYDIYIDDSPQLVREVNRLEDSRMFLYSQPYNEGADGEYERIWFINSVCSLIDGGEQA